MRHAPGLFPALFRLKKQAANSFQSAFISSITGFVIISITILACASPNYSSAEFVFTDSINETGWPDGIGWLLGLLQAGLGLTGFDAVAHMIEEIPIQLLKVPRL